jgi:hypothetical protein
VRNWSFRRAALGISAAAMLAGCGGSQPPIGATAQNYVINGTEAAHHKTFDYTGAKQSFTVPDGVTSITVVALGAAGFTLYAGSNPSACSRERGGRIFAVIPVTPNQRLTVYVGGVGLFTGGGFNGGGVGSPTSGDWGGWGGGASDVRVSPGGVRDRIIVAGGGGGEGGGGDFGYGKVYGCGGGGGGLVGGKGLHGAGVSIRSRGRADYGGGGGGRGGTQTAGGDGGLGGAGSGCKESGKAGGKGALGVGGDAATNPGYAGGGGGGGYFGGGGGGSSCVGASSYVGGGGGGGGGSSYAEPLATKVRMWQDWKTATGNGLVVFSW